MYDCGIFAICGAEAALDATLNDLTGAAASIENGQCFTAGNFEEQTRTKRAQIRQQIQDMISHSR